MKHKYSDISYPNKHREELRAQVARDYETKGKKLPKMFEKKPGAGARAVLRGKGHVGRKIIGNLALKAKVAR